MPTVLIEAGFLLYSRENVGPPHIHVEFGDKLAKYWLQPVEWRVPDVFARDLTDCRASC